jgi:uncharacterized membrane protein
MNAAHIHLMINHFPIILPFIAIITRIIAHVIKSDSMRRYALGILIVGAITSFIAMQSGERAEEIVEDLPGISETYIHNHEESAEIFSVITYIAGGIACIALWADIKRKSYAQVIVEIAIVLSAVSLFYAQKTGTSGGEIRHEEIR